MVDVTKSRTGLTTERGRKIYSLTEAGTQVFEDLLAETAGRDEDEKAFAIRMAFARYLPREARLRLLVHRREQLSQQLQEARQAITARTEKLDSYRRSLMEHGTEITRFDIEWLDSMIASEQQITASNGGKK